MDLTEKNNSPAPRENKMGIMPVNKLLLTMSIPMMISMLVQAMYNVVDSIFVAQVSENALTAVSLAFPMQNLLISVAVGTGVGVNALLSKSLGEKNFFMANKAANNALFLAIISWLVFIVIGISLIKPFYVFQTTDSEIVEFGIQYLEICCIFSLGVFVQVASERLLQSTGKTFYSMIIQTFGAVINIILDPILIFGLFGFPRLEVAGAAIATVSGQILSMFLGIFLNIKFNKEIVLKVREIRPYFPAIKRIYSVGVPSIIMSSVGSVMTFGMNKILIAFSTTATAVFGVYFKVQSFFFMPVFGLNNGIVPIIAYNYGAKKGDRMMKTVKLGIIYATSLMIIGLTVFQLFPDVLFLMFKASPNMLSIGIPCFRTISISFIFAGFCIVSGSVFQAVGNGFLSLWVSIGRQLVVLLPAAYILAQFGNVDLVWWSFPIAEIASLTLSLIFLRKIIRTKIKPLMADPKDCGEKNIPQN
ncbi:MAG: MATE family efflux transporter [Bacillota bacterium]|nr:MATE family efflux transporter [Bacillota bacterium]